MLVFSRGTPWSIGVIATLVLLASISSSESVKVRKLRRRPTTRAPHQQQFGIAPVLIKVINKHPDKGKNGGASSSCTDDACRNALEKLDVSKLQDNYLLGEESMRYIVYPKKYEHFVSKKNTGSHRYKRDVPDSRLPEAGDKNTGKTLKKTGSKVKKVSLYNTGKYTKIKHPSRSSGELGKTKRSIDDDDYPSRARNASDYYAQRRAVMERFYARQREINARYATNRTDSKTDNATLSSRHQPVFTSNATLFGSRHLDKEAARRDTTFRSSVKIDPIYNSRESRNKIPTAEPDNRRNPAPQTDLGFKSDPSLSQARSSDNVERNALDYYVTPTSCPNASLSGTFAPKTRPKHGTDNRTDHVTWGKCEGEIAYQHNLLLGITGPSTVDAVFEVILEGPLCITCVETVQFNDTRARVKLHSGGRGKGYVKLWLQGYENEGFSYIIKIWAVQKTDESCSNVD